eukprot:TRINITY_DN1529_c0_g3_i1.p1 TRINITY_DN1529_c0_g3~~TRINITY_DN1529_c0_g3_i1.p1  ORF type:complete len:244 (+),score=77.99 TRINITY_DN1529_c0_g3_i1:147-878(+)
MIHNLSMESLKKKREIVKKMWIVYGIVMLIFTVSAVLTIFFPLIFQAIMTHDVSTVSFVCLVVIQLAFDSDTEETFLHCPSEFYLKLLVYFLDTYLLLISTIKPGLIIFACLTASVQLVLLYFKVCYKAPFADCANEKASKQLKGKISEGSILVTANICALTIILGKGFIFRDSSRDLIKAIISSALIVFYLNTVLKKKADEFFEKTETPNEKLFLFYAFKMIKPIGSALIPRVKKLQRIKAK